MNGKSLLLATLTALSIAFSLSPESQAYPVVPDPVKTQGDFCDEKDPDFTQYRYQEQIPYCRRNVTWFRREQIYDLYQVPDACRHRYTVDHFIPLALGGNNDDVNLWPEHVHVKATRPYLEQELFLAMDRGEITQKEAVEIIVKEKTKHKNTLALLGKKRGGDKAPDCDKPWENLD